MWNVKGGNRPVMLSKVKIGKAQASSESTSTKDRPSDTCVNYSRIELKWVLDWVESEVVKGELSG
jgi:hypothetical protein